ncbi:DUF2750 domain-containing protein [Photobacterium sp. WH77]|uniref:DUF2750 domain-containing protein n=2 Tax=Photobacterium TaxID=657 RepID=A0A7X4XY94_9GAMM|nr:MULTISPECIES: DUF2750 domain-containing protein [Photobacterium]MBD8511486.1 DUF2750 domain-containing protein [Photobacterium arenosum]MBV7263884.1 DUF2750 domain-containing protein [Photobacterium sp. WH24]MCG2837579.1 DUF2750 domain-containing protein [Photobacterium sp. WH77]MCG2845195.1 DUF2750 domain-containing protein [Photobacterium sp. WH80]MDO6583290.1 DUF2750 domain-containing protein [Photobacterium sp. 2_MG-2023]
MTKLTADVQANAELFFTESKETHVVYGLCNEEGDWLSVDSSEFEESEVMPFWSTEADAKFHCVEEWAEFQPSQLPLDVFVQDWMITLSEEGVLVGLNWNQELEGAEMEPQEVAKQYL